MASPMALPVYTDLPSCQARDFSDHLVAAGVESLERTTTHTLQLNLGKLCNQACHHCHVEAGPKRTEIMERSVAERVMALLKRSPSIQVVDITGGAPELNPHFRWLVEESKALGKHVMDRCNLTIFFEEAQEDLAAFLAAHRVEVVASLPCYSQENVEKQRGKGVFSKSIHALKRLNALGYGKPGSDLRLNLVYNPSGAFLPPDQEMLEEKYRAALMADFGIFFHQLFVLTNMPIKRFAEQLDRLGETSNYLDLLVQNFNGNTLNELMCRTLISVGWDGQLYDCDYNQMLEIPWGAGRDKKEMTIFDMESFSGREMQPISTGPHCFGCTAGSGSSCGGTLA